jgi:NADPH:quinone reductase-like Zn-dependent oxidoreductase
MWQVLHMFCQKRQFETGEAGATVRPMKAIVFDRIGSPEEVLELREVPAPQIGPGEVLVRMVSASINPGDSLFIQSLYPEPKKPVLPQQIAGNHGAGIVIDISEDVSIEPGTLVAFSYYNTWAEYAAVPAEWLIPLPSSYPLEKAGQLLNPITAWDLLDDSQVQSGQWVAVTAANSSVATMVAQFARRRGVNVIPLGRQTPGDPSLRSRIMGLTEGRGLHGVIDCVGGPLLRELIECLVLGGQVVIYGGMSEERFALHNFDVLLNIVTVKPHIYRFFGRPPCPDDRDSLRQIINIFGRDDFRIPVGGAYPLEAFAKAIQPSRGKNYFVFPATSG